MALLNETHDPQRSSWVASANLRDAEFPIQNLPHGVFRRNGAVPRGGVAIGDSLLDMCSAWPLFSPAVAAAAEAAGEASLNRLMAMGSASWSGLRAEISRLLSDEQRRPEVEPHLVRMEEVEMVLPAVIGDYTDFFASIFHATNTGSMLRPENPLLPNYKWIPIGYHGRASSVVASGHKVKRPAGQLRPREGEAPLFGPSRSLDYELEMGLFIGPGNAQGTSIPIAAAGEQIFGFCLLNDWSARDMQAWEAQPLGPFLGKSFVTTISPWIVTSEALAPFRTAVLKRPAGDPAPLPYLACKRDAEEGALDVVLDVLIRSAKMREAGTPALLLSRSNLRELYWSPAQLVAHHASNGCNLRPADLFGTGTASGPTPESRSCLLELTWRGSKPFTLPSGEERRFLEDGDEITLRGRCERPGFVPLGFGECCGVIEAA